MPFPVAVIGRYGDKEPQERVFQYQYLDITGKNKTHNIYQWVNGEVTATDEEIAKIKILLKHGKDAPVVTNWGEN